MYKSEKRSTETQYFKSVFPLIKHFMSRKPQSNRFAEECLEYDFNTFRPTGVPAGMASTIVTESSTTQVNNRDSINPDIDGVLVPNANHKLGTTSDSERFQLRFIPVPTSY